jgi:hypothetical protein
VNAHALLRSVRHPGQVTAAGALAWFAAPAAGGDVIGYSFGPDRAEWFRCADSAAHGPDGPRSLGGAFELFATAGTRQLRWLHRDAGRGWAVCLGEDAAGLPPEHLPGDPGGDPPPRRRLPGTTRRLLAGRVAGVRDGWVRLVTARYPPCDVPVSAREGQDVWALLAEYAVTDRHGNVSVADTLLLSLTAQDHVVTGRERQGERDS